MTTLIIILITYYVIVLIDLMAGAYMFKSDFLKDLIPLRLFFHVIIKKYRKLM